MSEFICKKPITLSGRSFSYGEVIPDGFVLPERALNLIRSNYITEIGDSGTVVIGTIPEGPIGVLQPQIGEFESSPITIPITTEKGNLELTTSPETVVDVLTIMQKTVDEAVKDIVACTDKDALLLLNAVDSRKGIQKAAEERNIQLSELDGVSGDEAEGGESTGDA